MVFQFSPHIINIRKIFYFCVVFIILCGIGIFAYGRMAMADTSSNLAGWWKFDTGSGTSATDSAGSNNGVLTNGPSWVSGKMGQAVYFDGQDDYVALTDNAVLSPGSGDFTVSLWIRTSYSSGSNQWLFSDYGGNANNVYFLYITTTGEAYGYMRDDSGNAIAVTSASAVNDGEWHMITLVRSGTTALLYVDAGTPVSNTNGSLGSITTDDGNDPQMGKYSRGSSDYYTGTEDDVRFYDRALSAQDIDDLYTLGFMPSVTIQAATDITATTATLNGTIISDGGVASTTDRGFWYGLTTSYGSVASTTGTFNLGSFTENVTSLVCNTTYHLAAFATNSYGTGTSTDTTFATSDCPNTPTVSMIVPETDTTVSNTILLSASASGDVPISNVQFKYGNTTIGSAVTSSPYVTSWDTSGVTDGAYSIVAVAQNTNEVYATSTAVNITIDNSNHYYSSFTPLHEYYVSPQGTGDGSSSSTPMSIHVATSTASAGDEYWLMEGTYSTGLMSIQRSGTSANPIVYRAVAGQHVTIRGTITITGDYNWIWGMDITDPDGISNAETDGVNVQADGVRIINNVIHDLFGSTSSPPGQSGTDGIGGWDSGSGQVYYGNIIYGGTASALEQRGHNIYTQNQFSTHGYKYYVNNISIDPPLNACNLTTDGEGVVISAQDCYVFHAYTAGGSYLQGFFIKNNIFANGDFLLGGYGVPADRNVVDGNFFYNSTPDFGYRRPTQVEFKNNYSGKGTFNSSYWWGAGEVTYTQYAPNIFTGNSFYTNISLGAYIRTSAYTSPGVREEGIPRFQKSDIVDDNIYTLPFDIFLNASSTIGDTITSLVSWQATTSAAGNQFDANSQTTSFPPADHISVIANEYESGRANIAIYNWSGASSQNIDISSVVSSGDTYEIYSADDMWGTPVASGTYSGSAVSVPTGSQEFLALVMLSNDGSSSPEPPPPTPSVPIIIDAEFSGISQTSVTASSTVTSTGGASVTGRGFAYGTNSILSTSVSTTTESGGWSTGPFSASLTSLTCNTTYYVRPYATNSAGTTYGSITSLTTSACTVSGSSPSGSGSSGSSSGSSSGGGVWIYPSYYVPPLASTSATTTLNPYRYKFVRNLGLGMKGEDVRQLQIFLNSSGFDVATSGYGSPGKETTFFGFLTAMALVKFQNTYANLVLAPIGLNKGTGYFGMQTRWVINSGMIANQNIMNNTEMFAFTRNLKVGSVGQDVKELQRMLNKRGYIVASYGPGSLGNETTYFGHLTEQSLIKFQRDHGVLATGYFDQVTHRYLIGQ